MTTAPTAPPDAVVWQLPADQAEPPPPPPRRRWSLPSRRETLLPRSVSGRLVTGVVALVVAIVLLTGGCTYFALRSFLYNRLDQQLTTASAQNAHFFAQCLARGGEWCPRGPQAEREWVNVV